MDRDGISILYREPSIDASYQVSVPLAEWFQRRRLKCEKLTDDRRQVMAKAHVAFGKVSKKWEKGNNERNVGSRPELRDTLNSYILFVYKTAFWSYLLYFGRQF